MILTRISIPVIAHCSWLWRCKST